MDPVTGVQLAASAVQLVDLAFKVFTNLHQYYCHTRDAPARSADLRTEVDLLTDLLISFQESIERHPHDLFRSSLPKELAGIRHLLMELYTRTKPKETVGYRRLHWPFREKENAELISKIERHKQNLVVSLHLGNRYSPSRFSWTYMFLYLGASCKRSAEVFET